jgi:RNA-directed DNA polymerase
LSLATPESVQKLQTALHDKAKESPDFRFYALYDKVYRKDVLVFAYECCKANGGAAGVDGQTRLSFANDVRCGRIHGMTSQNWLRFRF